jgi:Mg-chelatase subunit ChlD
VFLATYLASFLLVITSLYSCSGTDFSGSASRKNSPAGAQLGPKSTDSSPDSTRVTNPDITKNPPTTTSSTPGSTDSGINNACFAKKALEYNIIIAVDASLSQRLNDPRNLRGQAVIKLAANLSSFARQNGNQTVKMAVIGFARDAQEGPNGITNLTTDSPSKITQDLITISNMAGVGTNYDAALVQSKLLFDRMGAGKKSASQRNFLVFISDGEPNRGENGPSLNTDALLGTINRHVTNLIDTFDAALITVATGSDIGENGLTIIKSMAKPADQRAHPDHKGHFIRVEDDAGLSALDNRIGQAISGC